MNKEEYFDNIEDIRQKIANNLLEGLDSKLEELYRVKPVRLLWFVAKAELMIKQNVDFEEVYKILESKGWELYNYHGMEQYLELYLKIATKNNNIYDENRYKNILKKINENRVSNVSEELYKKFEDNRKNFLNDFKSLSNWREVQLSYYQLSNYIMYEIMNIYGRKKGYTSTVVKFIHDIYNMEYLNTVVGSKEENVFIAVAANENDYYDCMILGNILVDMGQKVYVINLPMTVEVENAKDAAKIIKTSIDNFEANKEVSEIKSIQVSCEGKIIGDNREYIIDYICKNYTQNGLATILCSGRLLDELCIRPLMKQQMDRLSPFQADYIEDNMAFGWVGKYTSYISQIYDFDVEAELQKSSECDFSIIIPARNSAASLRYALQTCLNQRYSGSYEIVLSDNSSNGNTEVYDLYCELKDPRIKYYKTPRDLNLSKSFEFAFLKAKGDFVMSIGSDDALLPWSLEILEDVLRKYPKEEIFQWERGFYAWPGFNGGQENQFVIPSKHDKDKYEVYSINKDSYFTQVINYPQFMYGLPMLYINSGFRRSYMNTLLSKTGRLWDGISQDVYICVINVSINDYITYIKYPLAIAGMTEASSGKKSSMGTDTIIECNNLIEETIQTYNIGGLSTSAIERLIPVVPGIGSEIGPLYSSILRAIARGVQPIKIIDSVFNWKRIFVECFNQLQVMDILYDKKLHYFRYTASKHGEEFLKWFDENIYEKAVIPREIDNKKMEEFLKMKKYKEGTTKAGEVTLDASKYGVTNVYEASLLFEKITKL